jgi:hypothetical protein
MNRDNTDMRAMGPAGIQVLQGIKRRASDEEHAVVGIGKALCRPEAGP